MLSDGVLEALTGSMESAYKRGMEMFNVVERLTLLQMLPKEGSLTTIRLIRKLRDDLSFDAKEHEILKFVEADGKITWNTETAVLKSVEIPEPVQKIIVEAFSSLDAASKLTMETAALYERFLPKEEMSS